MARRRQAVEPSSQPLPEWVRTCFVEDWLTEEHMARLDADDRTLELHARSAWSRERRRWARDHHIAERLPLGGRPVWRNHTSTTQGKG